MPEVARQRSEFNHPSPPYAKVRMSEAIPPLPYTPSLRKKAQLYLYKCVCVCIIRKLECLLLIKTVKLHAASLNNLECFHIGGELLKGL